MPDLLPSQKQATLQANNYPTDGSWDVTMNPDGTADIVRTQSSPNQNPSSTIGHQQPGFGGNMMPQSTTAEPQSSMMGAFGRQALNAAPSAITGSAVAGGLASVLGAPETAGISLLGLLPLLGGIGASMGESAIQPKLLSKILPQSTAENWQNQLALDAQQHPYASMAGGAASMMAGGMNPSVGNLMEAGSTLGKVPGMLMGGSRLGEAELQNLANIGMGAGIQGGIGAGQNLYQQLQSGQPIDYSQMAKEGLEQGGVGALFSEPNAIGRNVYKFKEGNSQDNPEQALLEARNNRYNSSKLPSGIENSTAETITPEIQEEWDKAKAAENAPANIPFTATRANADTGEEEYIRPYGDVKSAIAEHMPGLSDQVDVPSNPLNVSSEVGLDEHTLRHLLDQHLNVPTDAGQGGLGEPGWEEQNAQEQARQARIGKVREARLAKQQQDESTIAEAVKQKTLVDNAQQAMQPRGPSNPPTAEQELMNLPKEEKPSFNPIQLSQESKQTPITPSDSATQNEQAKVPPYLDWATRLMKMAGVQRNIKVDVTTGKLYGTGGNEVNGLSYLRDGIKEAAAKLTPNQLDTFFHEPGGHIFFHDLLNSPNTGDQRVANNMLETVKKDPRLESWSKENGYDPTSRQVQEEYLAQHAGEYFAQNADKSVTGFREGFKELVSAAKLRYGNATSEDASRILHNRFFKDPSFYYTHIAPREGGVGGVSSSTSENPREQNKEQVPIGDKEERASWDNWEKYALDYGEAMTKKYPSILDRYKNMGYSDYDSKMAAGKTFIERMAKKDPEGLGRKMLGSLHQSGIMPVEGSEDKIRNAVAAYNTVREVNGSPRLQFSKQTPIRNMDELRKEVEVNTENKGLESDKAFKNAMDTLTHKGSTSRDIELQAELGKEKNKEWEKADNQRKQIAPLNSAALVRNQDKNQTPINKENKDVNGRLLSATSSGIDDIRRTIPGEQGKKLGDALTRVYNQKEENMGKFSNPGNEIIKELPSKSQTRVLDALYGAQDNKRDMSGTLITTKERQAYNKIKDLQSKMADERVANNQPVITSNGNARKFVRDDNKFPTVLGQEQGDTIRKGDDTAKIEQYHDDFVNHQMAEDPKTTKDAAEERWDELTSRIRGNQGMDKLAGQPYFSSARKQDSISLPSSMRETNLGKVWSSYSRKAAGDMAWYKHIESNPEVGASLGYKEDGWGNKLSADTLRDNPSQMGKEKVSDVVKHYLQNSGDQGMFGQSAKNAHEVEHLASSMIVGPIAQSIHKPISSIAQIFGLSHPSEVPGLIKGLTQNRQGWQHAVDTGLAKISPRTAKDNLNLLLGSSSKISDRMGALAELATHVYTLGGASDKFMTGWLQSSSEHIMASRIARANAGNTEATNFLKHYDPDYEMGKHYDPKELQQMASRLAGTIHGATDPRTLPNYLLKDTELSAFLKLGGWQVSAANGWMRNVWTPATKGNVAPLIMSAMGATLGGAVIKKLKEEVSGNKSPVPTLTELLASDANKKMGLYGTKLEDNKDLIMYHLTELGSLAGFGGILSSSLKDVMDMMHKNSPNGLGAIFPLDEVVSSTGNIAEKVAGAIRNGDSDIGEVMGRGVVDWAKQNIQLARVAIYNAEKYGGALPEDAARHKYSQDLGDERRFEMASGQPYEDQSSMGAESNPYLTLEENKFKKDMDIPRALQEELPALIHKWMNLYGDKPQILMQKLQGLKQNEYATEPNPDENPAKFASYQRYLGMSQGEQTATDRLIDFMKHRMVNEVKSSIVP